MRLTRETMDIIAKHLAKITEGRITLAVGSGPRERGYRVATMQTPTARQVVWHSTQRTDARKAAAYIIGAVDAYTQGADFPPFLRDLRTFLAWRPELREALAMGRADGEAARAVNSPNTAPYQEDTAMNAPQCATPGCTRDAAFDGEAYDGGTGEGSYYSNCERCSMAYQSSAGLHAHRHSYSAAQCEANGYDPAHTWWTATTLRPVIEGDKITGWECRESLPRDRGACGYVITAEDMAAYNAHRQEDMRLTRAAYNGASNPANAERIKEARATLETFRADWKAAHPEDIR
jgi:hypothetical protein